MNMSPNDLPRVPGSQPERLTMQPAPVYLGYPEDIPARDNRPALLLGLGLAGGVLIGAAVFFMIMPGAVPVVEKKVEIVRVEVPVVVAPAPAPVQMAAPVVVEPPPLPVAIAPPPPPPVVVAPPPIVVTAPAFTLPRGEIIALLSRARNAISEGDISVARSFLERAASTNDPTALLMLGETYDPESLRGWNARGVRADVKKARDLYTRALNGGERLAQSRLDQLR